MVLNKWDLRDDILYFLAVYTADEECKEKMIYRKQKYKELMIKKDL